MQMLGEIETAFHIVNNGDHVPRHRRLSRDRRITILEVKDALNHPLDFGHFVGCYFATIEEVAVFLSQGRSELLEAAMRYFKRSKIGGSAVRCLLHPSTTSVSIPKIDEGIN